MRCDFDDKYGENGYGFLRTLSVVREYQRKGIGTLMVKWGIEKAEEKGLGVVTLCASDEGLEMYKRLGFVVVGNAKVKDDDGTEMNTWVMVLDLQNEQGGKAITSNEIEDSDHADVKSYDIRK